MAGKKEQGFNINQGIQGSFASSKAMLSASTNGVIRVLPLRQKKNSPTHKLIRLIKYKRLEGF